MAPLTALVVVTGLLGAAFAGPVPWDDSQCSTQCSSGHHKFQYAPDKTYIYSYYSQTQVGLTEDESDAVSTGTKAEIRARVEIHVLGRCEMILKLRDVSLSGTGQDLSFKTSLEAYPLPFAFDDGNIRELCPAPQDKNKPFVLNTKRAILSAFKNTMNKLDANLVTTEVDIAGECATTYKTSKGWSSITITKSKDLTSCKQRMNSPASVFGKPYLAEYSPVQNVPLLFGQYSCQQTIDNGVYQNVECHERQTFSPLSRSTKGAAVDTTVKMVLKDTKDGVTSSRLNFNERTTLLFSSKPLTSIATRDETQLRQVIQQICTQSREGVRPNVPSLIAKLIAIMREQPYENIARIYESLENNQLCPSDIVQDIYVDALSMAGTEGPVKYMAKLVKENKISNARQSIWLTSLAFNTRVDEGVIRAVLPLLKDYTLGGRQALLSISSMIYNFCSNDTTEDENDCEDHPVIKEVIAALQKQLGNKCKANDREEEHRIRETLAAFENIGRTGDAEDLLTECFVSKSNSNEIRHSAILAFRRAPCKPKVTKRMMEIYQNEEEEADVRIYAYRGAMRCATKENIQQVIQILQKERVQQVGAFVLSHLKNMKDTSSPLKQDIRKIVADEKLNKLFPSDPRKYSQYFELSTYSERLNVGGDMEFSVVRSPKTFIPKSAMLNFTSYILGNEVNLLEIGGHMDGMAHLLEKYFGEEGYFSQLSLDDLLEKFGLDRKEREKDNEVEEEDEEKKRLARDTGKFSRINLLHERMNVATPNDPKISGYVSVLGRKIAMLYGSDIKGLFELKEAFSIMEILTELAQKQKVERSVSFQLVDTEISVPAMSGMEITLAVNATCVASIQAEGMFDIRKLLTSERSADIDGHFSPSAVVEVSAIMAVDSGVHRTAVKIVANAHTTQYIEGKVQIKEGRVINVKVNMPKEKVEFLTMKSDVYTVEVSGKETPLTPPAFYNVDTCSHVFDRPLGIEFCTHAKVPKPLYNKNAPLVPVGGPMVLQISLKKTDSSMRGYSFQLEMPGEHDYNELIYKAEFDTPGSRINRHYALETRLNRQNEEKTVNFRLTSPIKKISGTGSILARRDLKKARLAVTLDEKDTYAIQGELKNTVASGRSEMQPSLEINFPEGEPIIFKGSVAYTTGRKEQLVIDLQANRPLNKPSFLRGTIVKEGDFSTRNFDGRLKVSTDLTLSTAYVEARLHGTSDKQDIVYSTDLALTYKRPNKNQHTAKFTSKIQNLSTRYLTKLSTKTEATFSAYPEANTHVAWEFQHKPREHIENDLKILNGEHYQDEQEGMFLRILQVSKLQGFEHHGRKGESENRLFLNLPFLEDDVDLSVKTQWNIIDKPSYNFDADLKYAKDKHIQGALNYKCVSTKPMEMEIEAKLSTPKHEFIYQDKVKERSPNEYEGKTMLQWARGKRANVDYVYKIKTDSSKMHHEVDLRLMSPYTKIPITQKALLRVTRDGIDIRSHTQYEGRPVYSLDAKLARTGLSKIEMKAFGLEGQLEVQNDDNSKTAKIDVQNDDKSLHYSGSTEYHWGRNKKSVEIDASWNIEKDPSNHLKMTASLIKSSPRYKIDVRGRYGLDTTLKIQGDVESNIITGTHDLSMDLNSPKIRPIAITYHHEMEDETAKCLLRYLRNSVQQLEVRTHGKFHRGNTLEISGGVELKSVDRKLDGKEIAAIFKHELKTNNYLVNIRGQNSPAKPYTLNLEYTTDSQKSHNKVRLHATLSTPLPKYRSQEAIVTVDLSHNVMKFNADLTNAQNKHLKSAFLLQGSTEKGSGNFQLETPFKVLKSLKISMELDNTDAYTAEAYLEVNDDRKLEFNSKIENNGRNTLDSTVHLRSAIGPKYDLDMHLYRDISKKSLDMGMKREDNAVISTSLLLEKQGKNYKSRMQLKGVEWNWIVEAKGEHKSNKEQVYVVSSRGIGKPIAITLKWQQESNGVTPELTICPSFRGSECLIIEGHYKNDDSSYTLHRELGLKVRDQPGQEINIDYILSFQKDSIQNKFEIDIWGKEMGFDAKYEEGEKDVAQLKIKLPSREMLTKVDWKYEESELKVHAQFLADAVRQPSSVLSIDASHKSTNQRDSVTTKSQITITHPKLENPIEVTVEAEFHEGDVIRPVEIKADVEFSSDSNKKLSAIFFVENTNKDNSNFTLGFNVHQADRSALEFDVKTHIGRENGRNTIGGVWKLANGGKKYQGLEYLEFDHTNKEIHYYYRSPNSKHEGHATWKFSPGQVFQLDTAFKSEDGESSAKLVVDIPKPCIEIITFSEPGKPSLRYHMCVDSKSNKLMTITAESYADSEKLTDATVVFDRRDEKSFSAHFHWRPEKVGEILHQLMEWSDKVEASSGIQEPFMKFAESVVSMAAALHDSILSPLADHIAQETVVIFKELTADFKHIVKIAHRIYNQIPVISEALSPYTTAVGNVFSEIGQYTSDMIPRSWIELAENMVQKFNNQVEKVCGYGTHCYNVRYAYQRKGFEGVGEYIYSVVENMPEGYYKLLLATKDLILENLEMPSVNWEPLKRAFVSVGEWALDQMEPILTSEFINDIRETYHEYWNTVQRRVEQVLEYIEENINEQMDNLNKIPEIKTILNIIKEIKEEIEKELKKLNMRKTMTKIQEFAQDFLNPETLSNSIRAVTLDPENGKIEIDIHLPKSPQEIKVWLKSSNPFAGQEENDEESDDESDEESDVNFSDKLHKLQATVKQEWVPPFKAHAQLIGSQHYVTFDNTFYDFAGECSYLLARDFADGNFSVMVKYEGQDNKGNIDKSIIVVAGHKIIEIDPDDETVKVDDQDVELPFIYGPVTVVRRGSTIVIDYKKGLSVTCHLVHDYCTTAISGWYFGKTAGLFGTYDHEPHNDFMKPKGQISHNPVNFARSWEVSSGCRFRNLAQEINVDPQDEKYDICRKFFKDSSSPLKPCFQELKQEEYLKMCMRQVAIQHSPQEAMCTVAAAFAHVCRQKHFPVSLPAQCLKCQSKGGEKLDYGEKFRQHIQPQSADVIFIVEESQCNRAVVKDIDSIARIVDRDLVSNGYRENRFGLVAFGGLRQEMDAHSHTARGKIFFESKDIVLATEKMTYKPKSRSHRPDTFGAIKAAIRYPFRQGVSKNFVLLTCSACDEEAMTVSYSDIQNLLLQRGIVLHTLNERSIKLRKSSIKSKLIYGVDAQTVYRSKDVSQAVLSGTPDLRSQVSIPKDVCIALAQEVGGSFFSTSPLKEDEAKNWKSLLARRVADTAEPHACQDCDCAPTEYDVATTVCRPCKAPTPKRPVAADTSDEDDEY